MAIALYRSHLFIFHVNSNIIYNWKIWLFLTFSLAVKRLNFILLILLKNQSNRKPMSDRFMDNQSTIYQSIGNILYPSTLNPDLFHHTFKDLLHASQIGCNICRIRASLEGLKGLLYISSLIFILLVRIPVFVGTKSSIPSIERWHASRQIPHLFRRTFSFLTFTFSLKCLSQPSELLSFLSVLTIIIKCWTFATRNATSRAWTLPGEGQLPPAFSELEGLTSLSNFGSIDTWLL